MLDSVGQTIEDIRSNLRKLGNAGVPSFSSLDRLTRSLDRTGGIERLMELLFYGTAATNGFDSVGHYVRDQVLVGDCTGYAKTPVSGCSANFSHTKGASDAAAAAPPQGAALTGLVRYLIGKGQ